MGVEIERKFLLNKLPEGYRKLDRLEIKQGYYNRHKRLRRILRRDERIEYWLETKNGAGLKREETPFRIYRATFEKLWGKTKGRRLRKTRYLMNDPKPKSNLVFEIDQFHGKFEGFLEVEVEFRSVRAALRFNPPKWFGPEVTGIKGYTSRSLATYGLPKEYKLLRK